MLSARTRPPAARSWQLAHLQPTAPNLEEDDINAAADQVLTECTTDGSVEFIRGMELLKLADKEPWELIVNNDKDATKGVPPSALAAQKWW